MAKIQAHQCLYRHETGLRPPLREEFRLSPVKTLRGPFREERADGNLERLRYDFGKSIVSYSP